MLEESNRIINLSPANNIDQDTCNFCHLQTPDRNTVKRTGNAQLRTSERILCQVCHSMHQKFFDPGHLGIELSAERQAYMYARELLGLEIKPDPKLLARLQAAQARPTRMVPDSQGRITCSTCHNPHQEGVFPENSELAANNIWMIGPGRITSPSTSRKMCFNCHE